MFTQLTISLYRCIFLVIIGFGLIGYGLNNQHKNAQLQQLGVLGVKVLSQPIQDYKVVSKHDKNIGYIIKPSFLANDGKTYICSAGIDESIMNQLKQNPQIEITYVPNDPNICEVKNATVNDNGGSKGDFDKLAVWVGIFAVVVGSILALIKFFSMKKTK